MLAPLYHRVGTVDSQPLAAYTDTLAAYTYNVPDNTGGSACSIARAAGRRTSRSAVNRRGGAFDSCLDTDGRRDGLRCAGRGLLHCRGAAARSGAAHEIG